MRTLKGVTLLILGIVVTVFETYVLIIDPFINGNSTGFQGLQYWGLVFPSYFITLLISLIFAWVGYTMIVTDEPVRLTYEQAYEIALEEVGENAKNAAKKQSP